MSWLDDLTPEQEKANAAGAVKFTDAPPAPGFLTNAGQGWKGLPKGVLDATNLVDAAASRAGGAIEGALGIEAIPGSMGDREANERARAPVRDMMRREYAMDAATVGTAGQVLFEVNKIIPRTIVGGALAGPGGAAFAAGAPEGLAAYHDAIDSGIDEETARNLGMLRGGTTGVGALLPGSGVVKPALADLVATTGLNIGLGVLDRYGTGAILRSGGYAVQAAQYEALDVQAMSVDAVMGAAFWGAGRLTAGGKTPTAPEVEAALALNLDHHRRTATGPGLPVDPASARASGDAVDQALQAVLRGEPVNLSEAIAGAAFLRQPRAEVSPELRTDLDPAPAGRAAVIAAAVDRTIGLESNGRADAKNTRSTATGAGQFIEATWLGVVKRHRPDLMEGRTRAQVLALRTDGALSRELTTRFTEDNATALDAAGVAVDEASLYMAHHFGAKGAARMLQADPDALVTSFLTKAEIKANPHLHGRTVAQALDDFDRRAGRTPVTRAEAPVPEQVAQDTRAALASKNDVPEPLREALASQYASAAAVKPRFDLQVQALGRELGAEVKLPAQLKGLDRALEKTVADYAGDPRKLRDLVRGTLVVEQADGVEAAVAAATRRLGAPTKVRNTLRPDAQPTSADGYRDALMNFVVDGHTVELQVNVPAMVRAKEKAHSLYEEQRSISAKAMAAGRDMTPAEFARFDALSGQMRRIYDAAWSEATSARNVASSTDSAVTKVAAENIRGSSPSQARAAPVEDMVSGTPSASAKRVPSGKDSGNFMGSTSDAIVPPTDPASGLPQTPAIQAAAEAAYLDPSLQIAGDDGLPVSAAEVLATLAKEQAQVEIDASGYLAAANCFLRTS